MTPFVYIHIEAPDECGHMGDAELKKKSIEDFDSQVIGPVRQYMNSHPDTTVLVLPDHPTPCVLKTHVNETVPVLIAGPTIKADLSIAYNETAVKQGELDYLTAWDMLESFLNS